MITPANFYEALACTVALALVAGAALARIKSMGRDSHWCERVGYGVTFGGALGSALEWWWPVLPVVRMDTIFVIGCGVIALSVLVRFVQDRLSGHLLQWNGQERRRPYAVFLYHRAPREQQRE